MNLRAAAKSATAAVSVISKTMSLARSRLCASFSRRKDNRLAVIDADTGQIDRELVTPPCPARDLHPGEDHADDVTVDLADQPTALGHFHEHARRHHPAIGCPHAHQRLEVTDLARGNVEDRLVVDDEAITPPESG
jgi:hypothetical protein